MRRTASATSISSANHVVRSPGSRSIIAQSGSASDASREPNAVIREAGLVDHPQQRVAVLDHDPAHAVDPRGAQVVGRARRHAVLVPVELVDAVGPALDHDRAIDQVRQHHRRDVAVVADDVALARCRRADTAPCRRSTAAAAATGCGASRSARRSPRARATPPRSRRRVARATTPRRPSSPRRASSTRATRRPASASRRASAAAARRRAASRAARGARRAARPRRSSSPSHRRSQQISTARRHVRRSSRPRARSVLERRRAALVEHAHHAVDRELLRRRACRATRAICGNVVRPVAKVERGEPGLGRRRASRARGGHPTRARRSRGPATSRRRRSARA